MKKSLFHPVMLLATFVVISYQQVRGQASDAVLFSVAGTPVHVSEFDYIYSKTNGKNADYSRKSLEEYLDLYVKFKLKVQKAREMRLDTIPALKQELGGYRRQLADSYLIDKAVTEKLTKEAYDRAQWDVDISHILIMVAPDASPADTAAAYARILAARKRIEGKEDFATVAGELSDDKSSATAGGRIGFVTAPFPAGLYPLETLAYQLSPGKFGGPVRTNAGYHLVMVHNKRPARGEIEGAHILIRVSDDRSEQAAKAKIDSIAQVLREGAAFEDLAGKLSEDRQTAQRGGYVGFFGIRKFEPAFEEAAFALKNDGEYSEPIRSRIGWHIIKRISLRGIQPYAVEKSRLEARINRDPRFEEAKKAMLERIKRENNYRENTLVLDKYVNTLTDTFLTFRWRAPEYPSPETLFSLGRDYPVSLGQFTDWLGRASSKRLRLGRDGDVKAAAAELYHEFVNEELLKFEESQLENRYPEFKALMREYEEGILLFEATKIQVWDKANEDSVGLEQFFKTIEGKYRWADRAVTTIYRISNKYRDRLEEIRRFAAGHTAEEVRTRFNTPEEIIVNAEEKTFEKNRNAPPELNGAEWKPGTLTDLEPNPRNATVSFMKVESVIPPTIKTLQEARGYVVADYQDYLEKQWVEELAKNYKVKINDAVFETLIKNR